MLEFLLPRSDLGVLIQAVIAAIALGFAWWMTRNRQEWRLVTIGLTLLSIGFFGVRALH